MKICRIKVSLTSEQIAGILQNMHNKRSFLSSPDWLIFAWDPVKTRVFFKKNPLPSLDKPKRGQTSDIPFFGGDIFALSYNLGNRLLGIKNAEDAEPEKKTPLALIHTYENFICYDRKKELLHYPQSAKKTINDILAYIKDDSRKTTSSYHLGKFKPEISRKQYGKAFKKIQDYIKNGDIYQVNLTYKLTAIFSGQPENLFAEMYKKNPAEYSAFIEGPDFCLLCFSPEEFICRKGNVLITKTIKGTKPLTATKEELINSAKEAAELNMITDLLRNDLGKISATGSVKVTEHRIVQPWANVWHTHSKIVSKILPDKTLKDVFEAVFPGGSVTGCPKKRACEIIDELEKSPRDFYTGTLGYANKNGDFDTNIIIRTLLIKNGTAILNVGGGLVADSIEEDEYKETLHKAETFIKAADFSC